MTLDIMPDSRLSHFGTQKGAVWRGMAWWESIYCASCGIKGGLVPCENITSATWICQPCADTHGGIPNTYLVPDEVFFREVLHAQIEKYGRPLSAEETAVSLDDPDSLESRLAADRKNLTPKASG